MNNENTVTITIAGTYRTGKTFIKYQIVKHLQSLGLNDVNVVEDETDAQAIVDRTNMPSKYVNSMNELDIKVVVKEARLARNLVVPNKTRTCCCKHCEEDVGGKDNDGSYRIPNFKGIKGNY